jgi:regulator of protease activity HflC (stomatin/prohibitin superfamily)
MSDTTIIEGSDGPPPAAAPGPIVQSAAIGFRVVYIVTLILGVIWLGSNFRIVSSDSQAVVMQFGRIVRTAKPGLLLALPRPIEQVRLLPGRDRQLPHAVAALPAIGGISAASSDAASNTTPAGATPYLTGDGNVVLLDAILTYRITDPSAYVLSKDHVLPALDRLFRASAVTVAAGQGLNDFLVAQPTTGPGGAQTTINAVRAAVRERLLNTLNARLKTLNDTGDGLGVEIDRIDMTAWLPPQAKLAFDAVLTAGQKADQNIAAASTAAELRRQGAQREADRLISTAQAIAVERTTNATLDTTSIAAIERTSGARAGLEQQAYRNNIGQVLAKAGAVIVVDPNSGKRVMLTGPNKAMVGAQK